MLAPVLRGALALTAFLALGLGSGCASSTAAPASAPASAHAAKRRAVPRLSHVVVVMFENKGFDKVAGASEAPTFNGLSRRGARLSHAYGVAHPSLPNYLALISGSTQGITDDCTSCSVNAKSLADTLAARGRSWKGYAEGLPSPGFTGGGAGRYAKKHMPFLYFDPVTRDARRRKRVVPYTAFGADVRTRRLPNLSFVVPDLCNDMHDCSVATGDAWLKRFLPQVLRSPQMRRGAVFVLFDEADDDDRRGGGHIPEWVVGPAVKRGVSFRRPVTHYGVLRTLEDALGVRRLGASRTARPITGIWR